MNPPGGGTFAGYSGLLIGGTQITSCTTSQYVHLNKPGTVISGNFLQNGLKDIHVAQQKTALTVWFTCTDDSAGYYVAASSATISSGTTIPLLTAGKGGRLSGMITTANITGGSSTPVNTIISVDENSHLTSLQQSAASGSWDAYPLMMAIQTTNFEVPSYSTRLRVMSGENAIAGNATFVLKSSGRISAIMNGVDQYLDEAGVTLKADATGEATFIVATADVSCHTFDITNVADSSGKDLGIGTINVNPSQKAMQRLQSITDGPSLLAAQTPSGKKLVDPQVVSQNDINQAGPMIKQLANLGLKTPTSV